MFHPISSNIIIFSIATGGVYKSQWLIQCHFMNDAYKIFQVHVEKLQTTIPDTVQRLKDYPNLSIKG